MTKNEHAAALGRLGGLKKSEKKAAAARENGKKNRGKNAEKDVKKIIQTGQNLQETISPAP